MIEATKIISQNNDWISFVFLIILVVLAIVKINYKDRLLYTNFLIVQKKHLLIFYKEDKNIALSLFQVYLFFVQALVIALLFYFLNTYYVFSSILNGFKGYLIILLSLFIYFLARFFIGVFLSEIFNIKKAYKRVVYDKISYFNNITLWLLPFILICSYTQLYKIFFLKITLFIFIILVIIRYVLVVLNNKKLLFNNLFYFILYLCALEIAPLVIIFKLII